MGTRSKWTAEDDAVLTSMWLEFHIETIALRTGRTPTGVRRRADRLGLGGLHGRYLTLREAALATGYDPRQIARAAEMMGEPLTRAPRTKGRSRWRTKGRWFAIEQEHLDEICSWIRDATAGRTRLDRTRQGRWGEGRKPAACLGCGRSDRPHKALGLCESCHKRRQRVRRLRQDAA